MRARSSALILFLSLSPLALLVGACAPTPGQSLAADALSTAPIFQEPKQVPKQARSLEAFGGCEELLSYARDQLRRSLEPIYHEASGAHLSTGGMVTPDMATGAFPGMDTGGVGTGAIPDMAQPSGGDGGQGPKDTTGAGASSPKSPDHSKTNNQVDGVDEPDLVKSDGRRLFSLHGGTLRIMQLDGALAKQSDILSLLDLPYRLRSEMLIHGNRILVLMEARGSLFSAKGHTMPETHVIEIDASLPGKARVIAKLSLSGSYLSARKVDATASLVLRSTPRDLDLTVPANKYQEASRVIVKEEGSQPGREQRHRIWSLAIEMARSHNDAILAKATQDDFLPHYRLEREGMVISQGLVYGCEQGMHPGLSAGVDMLSVLSIDLATGLSPAAGTGVMSKGSMVYASASSLYVATRAWLPRAAETTETSTLPGAGTSGTLIHKFDVENPKEAVYRASGYVNGELLNQFAMSEHKGVLRVAATNHGGLAWRDTESFVVTLQEQEQVLKELGRVSGLGETERIRSVRFMGDVGYVVTFRRTDPLYTLDLKNPAAPAVLGELKIDGYSAYLHPLSPGYLLGVGQDADPNTGREKGMQISIFDVRDLSMPKRIHNYVLPHAHSRVGEEHRAFLYWPKTQSLVLPVEVWGSLDAPEEFLGAMLFKVSPESGIEARTRLRHPHHEPSSTVDHGVRVPIERSLVVGELLWTVSDSGVMASSVEQGTPLSWMSYKNQRSWVQCP